MTERLPPAPVRVSCDDVELTVHLDDGRTLIVPVAWYPRLAAATQAERDSVELSRFGLHWAAIDEDLSVEGLLRGARAPRMQSAG